MKTSWARGHQRLFALVDETDLLAGAARYDLAAVLDGHPVAVYGIGAVFAAPAHRGHGHADVLIERLLDAAAREGAGLALLFSSSSGEWSPHGFDAIPTTEVSIGVAESSRPGAPMTLIRSGEARDVAAIEAMGRVRADAFRFHLDRDVDLIEHAITRKRLLAGLGPQGAPAAAFLHR
jgi:Acetyltransferase (GNAT) domain